MDARCAMCSRAERHMMPCPPLLTLCLPTICTRFPRYVVIRRRWRSTRATRSERYTARWRARGARGEIMFIAAPPPPVCTRRVRARRRAASVTVPDARRVHRACFTFVLRRLPSQRRVMPTRTRCASAVRPCLFRPRPPNSPHFANILVYAFCRLPPPVTSLSAATALLLTGAVSALLARERRAPRCRHAERCRRSHAATRLRCDPAMFRRQLSLH